MPAKANGALKVLCCIANPPDANRFNEVEAWLVLSQGVQTLLQSGKMLLDKASLSEADLRDKLIKDKIDVLHFIGHAQSKGAGYASLTMLGSDGRSRSVASRAVASLAGSIDCKVVVLEACDPASFVFDPIGIAIQETGDVAVALPHLPPDIRFKVLSTLYTALVQGVTANDLNAQLNASVHTGLLKPKVYAKEMSQPIFPAAIPVTQPAAPAPIQVAVETAPSWQSQLDLKRSSGKFDVFLCHNSKDKPTVKMLGQRLKEVGILPWLDVWELRPGQPWQKLLEVQIGSISAAAVFVGAEGLGPWQEEELYSFLREFVSRKVPVIPVLLPESPTRPELPIFLRAMTWVDFRREDPDPFKQLLWGITGEHPGD